MTAVEFKPPSSLEEAEALRHALTLDVQSIQAQLGDKQRTDKSGRRLRSAEYNTWKKHATYNLNQKLAELRFVKSWIRDHRRISASANVEVKEPPPVNQALGHLKNLYAILTDLRGEDVEFDPEEAIKISAAKDFLLRLGIAEPAKETP